MSKARVDVVDPQGSQPGLRVEVSQPSPAGVRPVTLPLYPNLDAGTLRQVAGVRLWRTAPAKQYLGQFDDERGRMDEEWVRVSFGGGIYATKLVTSGGQILSNTDRSFSIDGPPKGPGEPVVTPSVQASPAVDVEAVVTRLLTPLQERAQRDREEWERKIAEERDRRKAEADELRARAADERREREERHKQDLERLKVEAELQRARDKADHERALERDRQLFGALTTVSQQQTTVMVEALKAQRPQSDELERVLGVAREIAELRGGNDESREERLAGKALEGLDKLGNLMLADTRGGGVQVQRANPAPTPAPSPGPVARGAKVRPNPSPTAAAPSPARAVAGAMPDPMERLKLSLEKIAEQIAASGEDPLQVLEEVAEGKLRMRLEEVGDEVDDEADEVDDKTDESPATPATPATTTATNPATVTPDASGGPSGHGPSGHGA